MPYIKSTDDRRFRLQNGDTAQNAGELNYQIFYFAKHSKNCDTLPILRFIFNFMGSNPNYQKYNDLTGCLVRCSREIKRRIGNAGIPAYYSKTILNILDTYDPEIEVYEDIKIQENGDVE